MFERIAMAPAHLNLVPDISPWLSATSVATLEQFCPSDSVELVEKTFVIIAHRLSTLKDVDRIVVLENGRVVEEGSPAALLQNEKSRFATMWRMQQEPVIG